MLEHLNESVQQQTFEKSIIIIIILDTYNIIIIRYRNWDTLYESVMRDDGHNNEPDVRLVRIDFGFVCIMYNVKPQQKHIIIIIKIHYIIYIVVSNASVLPPPPLPPLNDGPLKLRISTRVSIHTFLRADEFELILRMVDAQDKLLIVYYYYYVSHGHWHVSSQNEKDNFISIECRSKRNAVHFRFGAIRPTNHRREGKEEGRGLELVHHCIRSIIIAKLSISKLWPRAKHDKH